LSTIPQGHDSSKDIYLYGKNIKNFTTDFKISTHPATKPLVRATGQVELS